MSRLSEQLVRIHRKNYRKNESLIKQTLGSSKAFEKYENEYLKCVRNYESISTRDQLVKSVIASHIVYHGDYHTLRQSQKSVLRILREVIGRRDIILCLEMFHGADQKLIDRYMNKKIGEKSFLKRISYEEKWPFNWKNWKPMIYFCRDHGIKVIGINSETVGNGQGSLKERDQYSARIIAKSHLRYPDHLVYVVDGDYHVSPNHLPLEVNKLLAPFDEIPKTLVIYQNVDSIYWKLTRIGKEESDVLKINGNSYCVMNTMPANKLQSYLNWLELSEDAYFPVHKDWDDTPYESSRLTVHQMVKTMSALLNIKLPKGLFERLVIFYASDLDFMDYVAKIPDLKLNLRMIKEKVRRDEGFLLSYTDEDHEQFLIYLANSNINLVAEQASHFLNESLRETSTLRLSSFDQFYRMVMYECLGFFGSKLINEKRRSHSERSIRLLFKQGQKGIISRSESEVLIVAQYLLQHIHLQRRTSELSVFKKRFAHVFSKRTAIPRILSTQMGYMLGNKLYYAAKRGRISLNRVRDLYLSPLDQPGEAFQSFMDFQERLKRVKS